MSAEVETMFYTLSERHPEKQGLKPGGMTPIQVTNYTFRASSRKTRIETLGVGRTRTSLLGFQSVIQKNKD